MADEFENEAEAEPTITIKDYLNAVEEEELEADLVLGGDEGKECTYNKGYMKRQAIFSCLTCTPEGNAGVCTACCLSCHDGHEMVELWTKRNFRCDCGNSKFGEFYCKLLAVKDVENSENVYNHNFKGTYCTCDLPYPDPNAEEQVEMIQCCICEDWFHEEHIGLQSSNEVPRDDEGEPLYEDFICQGCAVVCSFLTHYAQTISVSNPAKDKTVVEQAPVGTSSENIGNADCLLGSPLKDTAISDKVPKDANVESSLEKSTENADPNPSIPAKDKAVVEQAPAGTSPEKIDNGNSSLASPVKDAAISDKVPIDANIESTLENCTENGDPNPSNPAKEKAVVEQAPAGTSPKKIDNGNSSLASPLKDAAISDKLPIDANAESSLKQCTENAGPSTECVLGIVLIGNPPTAENSKPMFLSKNWRDVLCRCKNCSDFYGQKGVGFLLDKEDTIAEYERMAKLKRNENIQKQEGVEQNFLNNLGHVEKIELLSGIADMKKELSAFLESSDPSKAITPADVHQVFENLAKRRKRMP